MVKSIDTYPVCIRDYLRIGDDDPSGTPRLKRMIDCYSCPLNTEIEKFLKHSAIEFTRKSQSVTYLVLSKIDGAFLGYFALAVKVLQVKAGTVSNTTWKKLLRTGEVDKDKEIVTTPAYLIAQLGKNYADDLDKRITGSDLLSLACSKVQEARRIVGGVVAFVEAEDKTELADFYYTNGFARFQVRPSSVDDKLVQYLRVL